MGFNSAFKGLTVWNLL